MNVQQECRRQHPQSRVGAPPTWFLQHLPVGQRERARQASVPIPAKKILKYCVRHLTHAGMKTTPTGAPSSYRTWPFLFYYCFDNFLIAFTSSVRSCLTAQLQLLIPPSTP